MNGGIFLKWGIPALVTVVAGTFAAVTTSGAAIPLDLRERAVAALENPADSWASVSFDMRDAVLTGTATTQQMIDDAIARVAAVHGVRSVTSRVVLAEYVSPFPFIASVADGVITLSGGLPDETARAELLELAGAGARDNLRLMSGAPDRGQWLAAARYVIENARAFDEGEAALADLAVTVSGRARNTESYQQLAALGRGAPPAGTSLGFREVEPPLASPFEWHASFDGARLTLSGVIPSDSVGTRLAALVPPGVTLSTSLALASGASPDFADDAAILLQNLLKLEEGRADISGEALSLSGSPADIATAETVRVAVSRLPADVALGPPRIAEYWLSAVREGDALVLDGFVPDAAAQQRLEDMPQVDAAGLELGRGAPERFLSGVDFLIEALGRMSEGHGTIQGTVITLDGRAATVLDFTAIETALNLGAPQGLILGEVGVTPPLAVPFVFTAEKSASGAYTLAGNVPSEAMRKALAAALPAAPADTMVLADGEPPAFERQVLGALSVLPLLDSGRIAFDGAAWSVTGAVDVPQEAFAADQAFAATGLRAAGWSYDIALPPPPKVAALPVIDPYVWRAQKAADGTVTFAGFVPTDQLKRYLAAHAGDRAIDGTSLAAGAPEAFVGATVAGLEALLSMREGALSLSGGKWMLTGSVGTTAERLAVEAALSGGADVSAWHVAIQAADAAPVVTPYVWSASKAEDGAVELAGYVPTEDLRRLVAERAGRVARDTTLVGSGEPAGFEPDMLAGIAALQRLVSGEVRFSGSSWSITGQPATAADAEAVRAALLSASDGAAGWTSALAEPIEAAPVAPEPELAAAPEPAVPEPAVADVPADAGPEVEPSEPEVAPIPAEPAPIELAELAPVEATPAVVEALPAIEVDRPYLFAARKSVGSSIAFEGAVPAEPMRRHLAVIGGAEADALSVASDLPADFITSADAGTRALGLLADGVFGLDGTTWVFVGRAESEETRSAALAALAVAPAPDRWQTSVTLLPPLEVCRDKVTAFAMRNAILFQSGSAAMASESIPAIDELAGYLAFCPEASVNVEGHTDADGEAEANLALSVARAEAVVDALILRGVGPERLYAIGYGESLPVADNETRAGKQANRRIAFTLADH
ncbi:OmpA family protein [Devosia sp.]|uniref:OmpA family protein n=1 Tax=Devosia sp. TaxID=1871048 RepID=UPI0035AF06C1